MLWASLASLAVGIGCIGWALLNLVGEQPAVATTVYHESPSSTATVTASQPATRLPVAKPKKPARPSVKGKALAIRYSKHPEEGDTLGSLSIPAMGKTLPIIEGTRTSDLKKGVGHYVKSVLPGAKDNCVLSGHRDTVFRGLGRLKIGDRFIVRTATGTYTYRISRIRIVHANDRTVIVPTDHAVLTVTTCYPFDFVGNAPDRYVLTADMVSSK